MYPRRLLLEDARLHGIPILPLDVNCSEPEYVAEEAVASDLVGSGARRAGRLPEAKPGRGGDPSAVWPASSQRFGIRLALQDVHGISDAEIRSIMQGRAERPFCDVGDFLRRTTVSRPVTEALAHAGAFDRLATQPSGHRAGQNRRTHLYAAMTTAPEREGDQLTLADAAAPAHRFADYSDAEVVRAELEVLGLDATRHIVSFFEPLLADLGVTRTKDLHACRGGQKVMVAGVKVASQTPAIRSGQRIIFLTLDDATGPVEVTVFESVQPKVAKTVFHSYAMAVWGQLRRTGVKGVSIIAEEVWDLTALHRARGEGRLREAMGSPTEPALPARRLWHSSPGSAG
jgi:error-prone DNA polymerase